MPTPLAAVTRPFELGKAVQLRSGEDATILACGTPAAAAVQAARLLAQRGIEVSIYNARFAQPLDDEMLRMAFGPGRCVLTVEDHGLAGGFGAAVLERAAALQLPVDMPRFRMLGIPPDKYVPHGSRSGQLHQAGLDAEGIVAAVLTLVGQQAPQRQARGSGAIVQPAT